MLTIKERAHKILESLPATRPELEALLGATRGGVYRAMATLPGGSYHVGGWVRTPNGTAVAVFHPGPGDSVQCPPLMKGEYDRESQRQCVAPVFRHWMDFALFGDGSARDVYTTEEKELIWPRMAPGSFALG